MTDSPLLDSFSSWSSTQVPADLPRRKKRIWDRKGDRACVNWEEGVCQKGGSYGRKGASFGFLMEMDKAPPPAETKVTKAAKWGMPYYIIFPFFPSFFITIMSLVIMTWTSQIPYNLTDTVCKERGPLSVIC